MVYIGVEFVDHMQYRSKEFWAIVPYEETDMDPIGYDGGLTQTFNEWVEDGINPDWSDEEKQEYYESCEWFWWPLDDEEIAEYKSIIYPQEEGK